MASRSKGYWYEQETEQQTGAVVVLNALRDYRASEAAMRRRTRSSMGMGETDLLALRYLLQAEAAGKTVGPKELGARLGVTSASTTTLVDRLVIRPFSASPSATKSRHRSSAGTVPLGASVPIR